MFGVNHLKSILSSFSIKKAVSVTALSLLMERSKSSLSQDFKGITQAEFPPEIF
jgi:hypothetical protein